METVIGVIRPKKGQRLANPRRSHKTCGSPRQLSTINSRLVGAVSLRILTAHFNTALSDWPSCPMAFGTDLAQRIREAHAG